MDVEVVLCLHDHLPLELSELIYAYIRFEGILVTRTPNIYEIVPIPEGGYIQYRYDNRDDDDGVDYLPTYREPCSPSLPADYTHLVPVPHYRLAIATETSLFIWDYWTKSRYKRLKNNIHTHDLLALPDERLVVLTDSCIHLFDLSTNQLISSKEIATGRRLQKVTETHFMVVALGFIYVISNDLTTKELIYGPDADFTVVTALPCGDIITASSKNLIQWTIHSHHISSRVYSDKGNSISHILPLSDEWFITASEDGTMQMWSVVHGHAVLLDKGTDPLIDMVLLHDGRVITASKKEVRLWDVDVPSYSVLADELGLINGLTLLEDGSVMCTASRRLGRGDLYRWV